jgi:hypothetical protein
VSPIDVEPEVYDAASKVFGQQVTQQLTTAVTDLQDALSGTGAMAGSDPGGTTWAAAYDQAVAVTVGGMTDLTNACYKIAAMLEQTGFNHGMAEDASDPSRSVPTPADTTKYVAPATLSCAPQPPSASGGSGSPPYGWGLIQTAVGYVWPNGHQDKLRTAASAWSSAAASLDGACALIPEAIGAVRSQQSREVEDAATVCQGMTNHIEDVAASCRSLSAGCSDFAGYIDQAHHDVEGELVSLVEWTAGIEAGGALLAVFSAGVSEAAAQAAEAARVAATASRVANIIAHLIDMAGAVARTITSVVTKIGEVAQRLKSILGAQLTRATAAVVDRLPGLAKDAETLATDSLEYSAESSATNDALYQKYLKRKDAEGKTPLSREAWQKKVDTLNKNKLNGDAYRDQVANDLGIVNNEGGWVFERSPKDIPGLGRRWDMTNQIDREAIEVKSGTTPVADGLAQLTKDERAIEEGWSVTWQLKTDLDPALIARIRELAEEYPGKFNYTVAGR